MIRRFSCFFVALAVLFCVSVPVFATGTEIGPYTGGVGVPVSLQAQVDVVDLFTYLDGRVDRVVDGVGDALTGFAKFASHLIDEDFCPNAPQVGGGHNFIPRRTLKDGQVGLYYVCEYCGKAYGEALEEAYQEYVETLPGTTYNSDGAFLWVPGAGDFIDCVSCVFLDRDSTLFTVSFPQASVVGIRSGSNAYYTGSLSAFVGTSMLVSAHNSRPTGSWSIVLYFNWGRVQAPVSGFYSGASGPTSGYSGYAASVGDYLSFPQVGSSSSWNYVNSGQSWSCSLSWPSFWVSGYVPDGSGNTYELSTRFSGDNNTGLYGYVQDGQLYQSTVGSIYNETTNVYQNPVTGETSDVSSWNYDYSDRSYTLTTDEGDEITVTYGDSAVTINEGGATYNVYYLMEETEDVQEALESYCDHDYASTVTTAPTCTASGVRTYTCSKCGVSYAQAVPPTGHNYQSAVTMAPTCVNTGVRTFTCSECGDSYAVSIAATGHTWETVRSVPTMYDNDTGQLVQQGYTLYECSVCHEQYRIDADSGGSSLPAPSSGGTSTGTDLSVEIDSSVGKGFLATIAHGLTEDLPEVLKAASEWFTKFPQFYSSFMTFVKDGIAGCLPDVPRLMMGFGFGMTTFIGIVRKIIGR